MCDCFSAHCSGYACPQHVDVHCRDFCMPREDYSVFCGQCLPDCNVVIYELVEKCPVDGTPAGYRMGVRYRRKPPKGYGITAVTPNTAASWVGRKIGRRRVMWFTSEDKDTMFRTRARAVEHAKLASDSWPRRRG